MVAAALGSGCLASNPITFTAEAVGEKIINKAVKENIRPLHDKVDGLVEAQKNQSATIRLMMENFSRDREELKVFQNVIYAANKESGRMHDRWEKYLKVHDARIAKIEEKK